MNIDTDEKRRLQAEEPKEQEEQERKAREQARKNLNTLVCSYAIFEDNFGVTKDTIRQAIKVLKDNDFLDILKIGTSNVYIINQEVAWSSWDNQKQYCQFDGKVLVSQKKTRIMIIIYKLNGLKL